MIDIFQELKQDIRQERMRATIKRYLPIVGLAIAVILIGAVGWGVWVNWQQKIRENYAEEYFSALAQPANPRLIALDELAQNANEAYRMLAGLRAAELADSDPAAALERLEDARSRQVMV